MGRFDTPKLNFGAFHCKFDFFAQPISLGEFTHDLFKCRDLDVVVPSGIEPLPTASEAIVLSIGPRDQCKCAAAEGVTSSAGIGKRRISLSRYLLMD